MDLILGSEQNFILALYLVSIWSNIWFPGAIFIRHREDLLCQYFEDLADSSHTKQRKSLKNVLEGTFREGVNEKKNVFFRALPESPNPPPPPWPQFGQLGPLFWTSKTTFYAYGWIFFMMIMMVSMIIMMIILVILMIIMTKMTKNIQLLWSLSKKLPF